MLKYLVFLFIASAGIAMADPAALTPFTTPDGRCQISFPGAPTSGSQTISAKNGIPSFNLYQWNAATDNGHVDYMLMYADYPEGFSRTLEQCRDGAVRGLPGGQLTSDAPITFNGMTGREFTCDDQAGVHVAERVFRVGQRYYQLIIVAEKGYTALLQDAFFSSFQGN
jgi:hypothetical protein